MLNERSVMEYIRDAMDNSIEVTKNLWLLLLPDNELEALQSEYNLLPNGTTEEQLIKSSHQGKSVLYDQGVYKVVFNMNQVGKNKQTQVALPAYYSILANRDRFGNSVLNPTQNNNIELDENLIYLHDKSNSIVVNGYSIEDVYNLRYDNIKNHNYTRTVRSNENDIDELYSLNFSPIGAYYGTTKNKLVFRDMFTDTSDYFNTYFRDYFYTNFDSDYQMEMSFEQIIPNMTKGMLFNRQFYAYAKGGNFYFTQFSNSKLLSYGSKMWWTGDHFVFKKGVEGSINLDKAGRYFSMDYSTGEEGQTPTASFLNIHLKGEYLNAKGGVDCFTVNDNTSTDYKLDRNLLFLGDYAKELDVMINNKLYFGQMGNWSKNGDERNYPASIYFNDDNREFAFKTPSSKLTYWFGDDSDNDDNVDSTDNNALFMVEYKTDNDEYIELSGYSKQNGESIPITIVNVDGSSKELATSDSYRYISHFIPSNTIQLYNDIFHDGDVFYLGNDENDIYNNSAFIYGVISKDVNIMLPQKPNKGEIVTIFLAYSSVSTGSQKIETGVYKFFDGDTSKTMNSIVGKERYELLFNGYTWSVTEGNFN